MQTVGEGVDSITRNTLWEFLQFKIYFNGIGFTDLLLEYVTYLEMISKNYNFSR